MTAALDRASFVDRPFGVPEDAVLDIPVPLSVNRTRKVNRASLGAQAAWEKHADGLLQESGQYKQALRHVSPVGPWEIVIILSRELCKLDPDNPVGNAINYLRRLELIPNDSPREIARIVIEWGVAPAGARILLRRYVA